MKCPFCGYESKEQHCEHCKAVIPVPKTKEEPIKKRKELKADGT